MSAGSRDTLSGGLNPSSRAIVTTAATISVLPLHLRPVHLLRPRRHTLSQTFGLLWPSKSFVHPTTECPLEFRPNDWSLVYLGRLKTTGLASAQRYSHKVFIPHLEAPLLSSSSNSNPDLFSTPVFPSKSEKKIIPQSVFISRSVETQTSRIRTRETRASARG